MALITGSNPFMPEAPKIILAILIMSLLTGFYQRKGKGDPIESTTSLQIFCESMLYLFKKNVKMFNSFMPVVRLVS